MDAIQVTNDEIVKVRKHFKVKEDDIKRDVKIIIEWLKQQQHLPKIDGTYFPPKFPLHLSYFRRKLHRALLIKK